MGQTERRADRDCLAHQYSMRPIDAVDFDIHYIVEDVPGRTDEKGGDRGDRGTVVGRGQPRQIGANRHADRRQQAIDPSNEAEYLKKVEHRKH